MKITQYTRFDDGSLRAIPLLCRPDTQQQELQLLNLYPDICFQQIGVFGGAITDAVGAVLEQLPYETAKKLISGYFGPDGIGYRAIRTHIDSCDFSTAPYSAQGEFSGESLEAFSLAHDKKRIIPWIKLAYELAGDKAPYLIPTAIEAVRKCCMFHPDQVQTGPALRGDTATMERHLEMLREMGLAEHEEIYTLISKNIPHRVKKR